MALRFPIKLRRRSRLLALLTVLGPGLITTNAGNDAGGIATYSVAGAQYGLDLLWVLPIITVSLIVVQEACARMGIVTGKGLADLIRERFGVRWTALAMLTFLVASIGTTASEFAGIAASGELFGVSRLVSIPLTCAFVFFLVVRGSYKVVEKVFVALTVVFFGYIVTAFITTPDWTALLRAAFVPVVHLDSGFLFMAITLIGTTVTSYMQFFLQATVVEKGMREHDLWYERWDVIIACIFADLIAGCIVITSANTLHPNGIAIDTAADAARALAPLAGRYAEVLFAVGLVGASLFGATVLPLATAYVAAEAIGWERGISYTFREAPAFMGIYTFVLALGALIALLPGMPLVELMVVSQFIDGLQLPVILVFIVLLAGNVALMRGHASGPVLRAIQWGTTAVLGLMSIAWLLVTLAGIR
jgi:Mn2+/Fe2+ NRAMP family transporter